MQNLTPSLYDQRDLLDRARFPRFGGTLSGAATHFGKGANLSCGDEVTLELQVEDRIILQARHLTRGCAICTASADMLCEHLLNTPLEPNAPEIEIAGLSPSRMKCKEVALEAFRDLYSSYE